MSSPALTLPRRPLRRLLAQPLPAAAWAFGALLLALVAHAPALPVVAWPPFALAAASRLLPAKTIWALARIVFVTLVYLGSAAVWGWFDAGTLRIALLAVLVLKWAESRRPAEHALVATAATVATAIGLLQWSEGTGTLFALAVALTLICTLAPATGARRALRGAARDLAAALPLAAVLFVFFPRIPGPLWDIGLSFGLPLPVSLEKSDRGLGVSAKLKPGQTQTGASEGQPVLVAEFRNWVPPTSLLYWRGPVFYDFDGSEWRLDADYTAGNGRRIMQNGGWRRGADYAATFRNTAQEVQYRIRLTPHNNLWLYGLDVPSRLTAESFIGPDGQVLAHMPVKEEISYELSSFLEWTSQAELPAALRARALALPAASNPRLRALGERLRQEAGTAGGDADAIFQQSLRALAEGGYRARERFTPPEGAHALDTFWFDTKEGNSEFFAAAYVVLMRAAGVPARLVTGYRGGKLMALTDFVVVKRSHAHAWAEIWRDGKGWSRVDPVDFIGKDKAAANPVAKPKPVAAPQPARAPASGKPPEALPPVAGNAPNAASQAPRAAVASSLPDLAALLGRWIFRLDAELQKSLLPDSDGGKGWVWLLAAALVGGALAFAATTLFARWRESRRLPPPARAWRRACRQLARRGLPPAAAECPRRYGERVAAARPDWAAAMTQLASAFAQWRYGRNPEMHAAAVAAAARLLINRILAESPGTSR